MKNFNNILTEKLKISKDTEKRNEIACSDYDKLNNAAKLLIGVLPESTGDEVVNGGPNADKKDIYAARVIAVLLFLVQTDRHLQFSDKFFNNIKEYYDKILGFDDNELISFIMKKNIK